MIQGDYVPTTEVSVIIPVFNAAQFLGECILSVLAQSFQDLELIIVDDHSSDQSLEIALSFHGPRVHVLQSHGRGAAAARNTGIAASQGRFLQFLDADDL